MDVQNISGNLKLLCGFDYSHLDLLLYLSEIFLVQHSRISFFNQSLFKSSYLTLQSSQSSQMATFNWPSSFSNLSANLSVTWRGTPYSLLGSRNSLYSISFSSFSEGNFRQRYQAIPSEEIPFRSSLPSNQGFPPVELALGHNIGHLKN